MDLKIEGRQIEIGNELRERVQKRMDSLDQRFGPITHARLSIEKKAHRNDQRIEVKAIVNIVGKTITVHRAAPTVIAGVNETLETLTRDIRTHVEKHKTRNKRK
ncbi:HPF/RaiA family ribosome-associated protein [Magnetococcales bacterium HHB-1]